MKPAKYAVPGDFHPDLDEIVSSKAFRRLSHKSQVMVKPTRDHFRSRLIHTIEVNNIGLAIGSQLNLNMTLISAMAMAHDIGHTPFAHAGERTIREVLRRELVTTFGVSERQLDDRRVFHHSDNSARLLLNKFDSVKLSVIKGVSTHSWAPWKKNDPTNNPIPETYEAQVLAIADQLASINHDTEDIIEGEAYTNYDAKKFSQEMRKWMKSKKPPPDLNAKLSSFLSIAESGYGRRSRIKVMVDQIVRAAKETINSNSVRSYTQARQYPITIDKNWCIFLSLYESFIRDVVIKKESWFVGRDSIAEALVSTVFNHIWPLFKAGQVGQLPLPFKDDASKGRIERETHSIEHYQKFHEEEYGTKSLTNVIKKKFDIKTWDAYIVDKISSAIVREHPERVLRLISIIDFVSGLTDRYCLEIFDRVYHGFTI